MDIQITVHQKGLRMDSIQSLIEKVVKKQYPEAHISVMKIEHPSSRPERFAAAQSLISDAKSGMEELKDELESWHDNLPENLQSSNKADELDEAVNNLDEIISQLEEAESTDVTFPGMY